MIPFEEEELVSEKDTFQAQSSSNPRPERKGETTKDLRIERRMASGSFLGLSLWLALGLCVAGVVAQRYWGEEPSGPPPDYVQGDISDQEPWAEGSSEDAVVDYVYGDEAGPYGIAERSEESLYPIPGPWALQEEFRGRDGWGGKSKSKSKSKKKKKGKKKKKCKKKSKKKKGKKKSKKKGNCDKKGWGPVTVSTDGVKVGWKGWIPPVKGAGWGWFGDESGHFSFTEHAGWKKKERPHFPDPGPPTFIKHGPIHHKVVHKVKGWGWH